MKLGKNKNSLRKILSLIISVTILFSLLPGFGKNAKALENDEKTNLRIASFNIATARQSSIQKIKDQLKEYKIDIAGLQEIDKNTNRSGKVDQLELLKGNDLIYGYFGKTINYGGGEYGIGGLSKYEMTSYSDTKLSSPGVEQRIYQRSVINVDGKEIAVYNTHLSYESKSIRQEQIETIKAVMDADTVEYKILTGDFNVANIKEFNIFYENYNCVNGYKGKWLNTSRANEAGCKQIDNIILSENMKINNVEMADNELSDHNMIYADIELLDEEIPDGPDENPPIEELVNAEWDMDEAEGTVINDKNNKYPGTIKGGVTWTEGVNGSGLSFDGTNGYVDLGMSDLEGDWSATAWVNKGNNTGTNAILLGGNGGNIKLEQYNNTKKVGITKFGQGDFTFNYVVPEGEWVHLAFVGDSTGTALYVNGKLQDKISVNIDGPAKTIGCRDTGISGFMKGLLDEVKIFNKALTEEEIAAIVEGEPEQGIDKTALKIAIDYADEVVANAVEGFEVGQYHKGAKDTLINSIKAATNVYENEDATVEEVLQAFNELEENIKLFNSLKILESTGDFNSNNKVDIGDLAKVSKHYSKNNVDNSQEWDKISSYDINKDGSIGEYEVEFISYRILK